MENNKTKQEGNFVEVPIKINPELKQIYLTGAVGTFTNNDFRMVLLNEKSIQGNPQGLLNLVREGEYELIMSHTAAKGIYEW